MAVAGIGLCRRHASTMRAIEGSEMITGMPDFDDRAPSLVGWIGGQLDAPIRELLARLAPNRGAALAVDPVTLVLTAEGGPRHWSKTWKLRDPSGALQRVSIEVEEGGDGHVGARVGGELIGQGMPPWIERRRTGQRADAATDLAERREFSMAMARSIELVMTGREVVAGD
ncbi:MAG: hypothetical protein ACRENL_11970 [Candidatus Dormibacteria bacterium]